MSAHGPKIPMTSHACGPLTGTAEVPGDKSISHRALILGALSVGETKITGLLEGQDVLDTAKAMQAFGAQIEKIGETWHVHGVGVGGFLEPEHEFLPSHSRRSLPPAPGPGCGVALELHDAGFDAPPNLRDQKRLLPGRRIRGEVEGDAGLQGIPGL